MSFNYLSWLAAGFTRAHLINAFTRLSGGTTPSAASLLLEIAPAHPSFGLALIGARVVYYKERIFDIC